MTEMIIGVAVIVLAAGILAWRIYESVTGKRKLTDCGQGCGGCPMGDTCHSASKEIPNN